MSDNTSAVAYLRNQGGTNSHRHMSVVQEKGNDTSSPLPSRSSECVSGPSVPEGSNPQDRVEPKPDRSRQDFSCLRQTIRGSVHPREEHEIGNIVRLTHSGGDVMESGQSCPELGWPVRVCVPSDKPDKGLSKQGQNRKRRDRPDSSRLAQPGVVSGPIRSRDRFHKDLEDFLKRLPKGSLYLRDNPQRGFTNLSGRCSESGAMLSKLILSRQLSNS